MVCNMVAKGSYELSLLGVSTFSYLSKKLGIPLFLAS